MARFYTQPISPNQVHSRINNESRETVKWPSKCSYIKAAGSIWTTSTFCSHDAAHSPTILQQRHFYTCTSSSTTIFKNRTFLARPALHFPGSVFHAQKATGTLSLNNFTLHQRKDVKNKKLRQICLRVHNTEISVSSCHLESIHSTVIKKYCLHLEVLLRENNNEKQCLCNTGMKREILPSPTHPFLLWWLSF